MEGAIFNLNETTASLDFSHNRPIKTVPPAVIPCPPFQSNCPAPPIIPEYINPEAATLSWKSNSRILKWGTVQRDAELDPVRKFGSFHITFSWHAAGSWRPSQDTNRPNQLEFSLAFDQNIKSSTAATQKSPWYEYWFGPGMVPAEYQNLTATAPSLSFNLKPLDYFLTTNLLLPGKHVFKADEPTPTDPRAQSGLAVPRDTILTGQIVQSQLLHVRRMIAVNMNKQNGLQNQVAALSIKAEPDSAPQSTLNDLKQAFLSVPDHPLLADFLISTVSSAAPEEDLPIKQVLTRHGFGHLVGKDMFELWGTTWRELFKTNDAVPEPGASFEPPKVIDLRVFGGYYTVVQPPRDKGEQFLVHPNLGTIRMARNDSTPQQLYDAESKKVFMSWQTTTGRRYKARFELVHDEQRDQLGMRCIGTVQDRGEPEPFEAYSRGFFPDEELEETGVNIQADTPTEDLRNDTYLTVNTIVPIVLLLITLVEFIFTNITLHRKINKLKKTVQQQTKGRYKEITGRTLKKVSLRTKQAKKSRPGSAESLIQEVNKRIGERTMASINEMMAQDKDFLNKLRDPGQRERIVDNIGNEMKKELQTQIVHVIGKDASAVAAQEINRVPEAGVMGPNERVQIVVDVGNQESQEIFEAVESNNSESLSAAIAQEGVEKVLAESLRQQAENLAVQQAGVQALLGDLIVDYEMLEGQRAQAEERVKRAESEQERERAKKVLEDLTTKFQEKKEQLKREEAERDRIHKERGKVDVAKKEAERREREAVRKKAKALEPAMKMK